MRPSHFLIFALLAASACKKDDFDINNLNGGKIIAQGHGGMGIFSTYPIDSPASVLACLHSGAEGSEIDVQLSKDSVLVCYHGSDLNEATDMSGSVVMHTWAELSEARYTGVPYTEHGLMRLEDLFTNLDDPRRFWFSLDLKLYPDGEPDADYHERYANALAALLQARNMVDRVFIESQHTHMLTVLQGKLPGARLMYYAPTFEEGLATATQLGVFGITMDLDRITGDQVSQAHTAGLWVALFNVQSHSANRDAIGMDPEIIQSDRIDHLVGLLD